MLESEKRNDSSPSSSELPEICLLALEYVRTAFLQLMGESHYSYLTVERKYW